jgi:hypothetical protein
MKAIFLIMSLFSTTAFAYKMTIYTDEPDNKKAQEVLNNFKRTYPFNQYDIEINIETVSADKLNCAPLNGIARLLGCNSENIAEDASSKGIDQAIIVKHSSEYGGSGGSIPVISSSSPSSMAIHEYLHTLGLCDEYKYPASETEFFCKRNGKNSVIIEPKDGGYASDSEARGLHMGDLPWSSAIKETTLITNGSNLGTGAINTIYATPNTTNSPSTIGAPVGMYKGQTCANATPAVHTWQPGGEVTIMDKLAAGLGAGNEFMVAKALESRGVRKKEAAPEVTNTGVNDSRRKKMIDYSSGTTNINSKGISK